MKTDLSGKNAIVTGASRGIGRAVALALADAGANVACIATNTTLLAEVEGEIRKKGRQALTAKVDVAKLSEVEAAVNQTAETFGSIDILVNNAGMTRDNLLMRISDEDWDRVLEVNLKGPFNFLKTAGRVMMRQRSGSIINVTSVAALVGNAGQANYTASKGGLISLTKTAARELASRSVRVNAVAPGFIKTDMSAKVDEKVLKDVVDRIPFRRMGEPQEIADVIAFLASDAATYITGQVIVVDGGMAM